MRQSRSSEAPNADLARRARAGSASSVGSAYADRFCDAFAALAAFFRTNASNCLSFIPGSCLVW